VKIERVVMIDEKTIEELLEKLKEIEIYLKEDNGGIEFVKLENDILYIKLKGECENCPMSILTLRAGVERSIMRSFPFIKRVEQVK
jgi:Fe-S cluster biogenesis protein NfuA